MAAMMKITPGKTLLLLMVVVFATGVLFVPSGLAREEEGIPAIEPIQPVPGFNSEEIDFSEMAERYFHITGTLDYKFDDRIVVGDRNLKVAKNVSVSRIRVGAYVGVRLDDAGKVIEVKRIKRSGAGN